MFNSDFRKVKVSDGHSNKLHNSKILFPGCPLLGNSRVGCNLLFHAMNAAIALYSEQCAAHLFTVAEFANN